MKVFLVDEDLPRSLARALSAAGMQSIHVIEAGLRGRSDSDVLAEANRSRRTLLTADLDFSNLLQYPLGSHAGIVIARFLWVPEILACLFRKFWPDPHPGGWRYPVSSVSFGLKAHQG